MTIPLKPDVVVIGGGPVGLWTAIQTRIRSGKEIVVLEKYPDYQRKGIRLRIDAASLKGIPKYLQEVVNEWHKRPVPIDVMEHSLCQKAAELGIHILKGEEADPRSVIEKFPSAQVFIGADGAHSTVREVVFNDEFRFYDALQYLVQVEYIVENQASPQSSLVALSETYKMQKFAEHVVVETTTPQENGTSRVTLQIFIDKATYDQMKDASFKHPYYFETDLNKVPEPLKKILIKWWGGKEVLHGEKISIEAGKANKMTVIPLHSYAAKQVVTNYQGRTWAVVGDAAAAFPFFRAINNGFLLGTKLSEAVAEGLKTPSTLQSKLKSYSHYVTRRVWIERIRALVKSFFLHLSKLWLYISNKVPWQTVKFKVGKKNEIRESGNTIWNRFVAAST